MRSRTIASPGVCRDTIFDSSTHRKSAPLRSRLPTLSWIRLPGLGAPPSPGMLSRRSISPRTLLPSASVRRVSGFGQNVPPPLYASSTSSPRIRSRFSASAPPHSQVSARPVRSLRLLEGSILAPQPLADQLRRGVDQKRQGEQQERREEERAVESPALRRLGDLGGDVRRERPEAVERAPVGDRRVPRSHQ